MSLFAFVPRSVKKKSTPSDKSPNAASSSAQNAPPDQREVSSKTPLISASALARLPSENVGPPENNKIKYKEQQHIAAKAQPPCNSVSVKPARQTKGPDLEDLAALVCLALSDYQLWSDVDLRRKIDWGSDALHEEEESEQKDNANGSSDDNCGYIPLDHLFRYSSVFSHALSSPTFAHQPETVYVKAIRTHAPDLLEVRLVLSSEDPSYSRKGSGQWSNKTSTQTGYEVRRKAPPSDKWNDLSGCGKADWDKLTIYLENIPAQFRSLPGTLKFVTDLLPLPTEKAPSHSRVQNITFPSHRRDQPGSIPSCKGFALVTLSNSADISYILDAWTWDPTTSANLPSADDNIVLNHSNPSTSEGIAAVISQAQREAQKFGLRALNKARWEGLKAEYMLYRQQLVDEINQFQEEGTPRKRMKMSSDSAQDFAAQAAHSVQQIPKTVELRPQTEHAPRDNPPEDSGKDLSQIQAGLPYPPGCLTFVRNVHPGTNKTTLRTLFSQVSKQDHELELSTKVQTAPLGDGIDYVDYMKGMENCYIRLSTPSHAEQLLSYFTLHPTMQASGLDGVGEEVSKASDSAANVITAEIVLGKREQVYWEKVPEKVRRQAVDNTLHLMHGGVRSREEAGKVAGRKQKQKRKC